MFLNSISPRSNNNFKSYVKRDKLYIILGVYKEERPVNINNRVLNVIQKDLKDNNLGEFKYEIVKKGRTIIGWNFIFKRYSKKTYKIKDADFLKRSEKENINYVMSFQDIIQKK